MSLYEYLLSFFFFDCQCLIIKVNFHHFDLYLFVSSTSLSNIFESMYLFSVLLNRMYFQYKLACANIRQKSNYCWIQHKNTSVRVEPYTLQPVFIRLTLKLSLIGLICWQFRIVPRALALIATSVHVSGVNSVSGDEEMDPSSFPLSFHLSIGFKKHVSEVFFVIYTRSWAPKFILPHMELAREVVRPGNNASSGKQNDSYVSSVVMVKRGGSKWPLLCICGLVFAFSLAESHWLILLFSIWRALWWKCRTITPSLREAPGSCCSKRNCWFHFFSKPPIGDRTAWRRTHRQLKPSFRKKNRG